PGRGRSTVTLLTLRYDLRVPALSPASHADQYAAALDQAGWAHDHGFAAVLVALHDPVRPAEDLAVLDLASGGRVSIVVGLGYRQEEFDMAGLDRGGRGRLVEENLRVLLAAWTGEPFYHQGRSVRVTPRLRLPFMPAVGDPALAEAYRRHCADEGFAEGWVILPSGQGFVHVSEDPERDWARIAPYALYDAQTYHAWQTPGQRSQVHVEAADLAQLKGSGVYRVVTPAECLGLATEVDALVFHPLMGGMPADLGWESLECFAAKVAPHLPVRDAAG
ncbi:MAG: LLM class flavin-dependent oxidoreductase, partial [Mycobacteriales bacterium]